jgi:hypothetical protein
MVLTCTSEAGLTLFKPGHVMWMSPLLWFEQRANRKWPVVDKTVFHDREEALQMAFRVEIDILS